MNTLRFETVERLELREAGSDAAIKGWDQDAVEVILDGDLDQCVVEQQENTLLVDSRIALAVNVPNGIAVRVGQVSGDLLLRDLDGTVSVGTVSGDVSVGSGEAVTSMEQVHGDLAVERLEGALSAGEVHGDAHLTTVSTVHLGQVHGDVYARSVDGELKMGAVSGDIRVRGVSGPLTLEESRGGFQGQDLQGGIDVHTVKGDISLKTVLTPGLTYSARADGNVAARFPAETSARFSLEANGTISARLPQLEKQEEGRVVGQAGEGEAQVVLCAGGDLSVTVRRQKEGEAEAWATVDSIAAQIEAQIAEHLGKMNVGALAQREIDKAMHKAEQEIAKAQRRIERETQRAEELARRAQERAARAARRAQERIARKSHKWGARFGPGPSLFGPSPPPRAPKVAGRGPSPEEQLAVLRMLQEGSISAEEAETLLRALEG